MLRHQQPGRRQERRRGSLCTYQARQGWRGGRRAKGAAGSAPGSRRRKRARAENQGRARSVAGRSRARSSKERRSGKRSPRTPSEKGGGGGVGPRDARRVTGRRIDQKEDVKARESETSSLNGPAFRVYTTRNETHHWPPSSSAVYHLHHQPVWSVPWKITELSSAVSIRRYAAPEQSLPCQLPCGAARRREGVFVCVCGSARAGGGGGGGATGSPQRFGHAGVRCSGARSGAR